MEVKKYMISEIASLAKQVAEKRSYVRGGFVKLLEAMSEKVADITSDVTPIRAVLLEEDKLLRHGYTETTQYALTIHFEYDAYFDVQWRGTTDCDPEWGPWSKIYPLRADPADLRVMAEKIPRALEEIRQKLAEMNSKLEEAAKIIDGMIQKLSA